MNGRLMKLCCRCRVVKGVDCFQRHAATPDGLQRQCADCLATYAKASRARRRLLKLAEREAKLEQLKSHGKACTKCGVVSPLSGFAADKNHIDGHSSWCQVCLNAAAVDRYRQREDYQLKARARAAKRCAAPCYRGDLQARRRAERNELVDAYIKRLLLEQSPPLKAVQVTPELIALKRQQLEVNRLRRELKQSLNAHKEHP